MVEEFSQSVMYDISSMWGGHGNLELASYYHDENGGSACK